MRIASILLALAIAAGVAFWIASGEQNADAAAPGAESAASGAEAEARAPVAVLVVASRAEPLASELLLRGVTEASRRVDVKAETEGLVVSDRREKGQTVAAGDLLCRLALGDRGAKLEESRAKLRQAESDASASERLSQRGFSAETARAADAAALEAARSAVAQMEIDIARTDIVAPFAGYLETDTADLGALLMPGATCATLIALDPIRVVGYAPERRVEQIAVGQPAEARLVTGRSFPAEVSFVARAADVETRTYRVEATAPNRDGAVRDGMTAELAVTLAGERAHRLPAAALTLDGEGRLGVRLSVPREGGGHAARFAPVTLERDGVDGVWVTGLDEAVDVIVLGQDFVTDGALIAPSYGADAAAVSEGAQR